MNELAFLKPLFLLSKCFATSLDYFRSNSKVPVCSKMYGVTLFLSLFCVYFWGLAFKIRSFYASLDYFSVCIDGLCEFFLIVSDFLCIFHSMFFYPNLTHNFINVISHESMTSKRRSVRNKVFTLEFAMVVCMLLAYTGYKFYVFCEDDNLVWYPIYFRGISYFIILTAVLQMYNFLLVIKEKYFQVNSYLLMQIREMNKPLFTSSVALPNIDFCLSKYTHCCDMMDMFNKLFGNQIFWITGFLVISTSQGIQVSILCLTFVHKNCSSLAALIIWETTILAVRCTYY